MHSNLPDAAISLLFLFLTACSQVQVSADPPATATQSIPPATDYVPGLSELPSDKILFVLAKSENSGAGVCDFPAVEQGLLVFRYSSGTLEILPGDNSNWLQGNQLMVVREPEVIGLGFFGFLATHDYRLGGGMHNEIYYIDELTYEVPSLSFIIYSVLEDGTIIAGVQGQAYRFELNQSWTQASSHADGRQPDCQITSRVSITNYGLLNRSDVKFLDQGIVP